VRRACRGFRELRDKPALRTAGAARCSRGTRAKRAIKAIKGDAGSVNVRAVRVMASEAVKDRNLVSIFCPAAALRTEGENAVRADDRSFVCASLSAPTDMTPRRDSSPKNGNRV